MANPFFSFKQFTVFHDKCSMKVGIDGVLLGIWSPISNSKRILDIGTGTGLIALMLAQRSDAHIDAIDTDEGASLQAVENVNASKWQNRISVLNISSQEFSATTQNRYDLIISNPPFFVNSLKAPNAGRSMARHTDTLTHAELIDNAMSLLTETGRICLILPVNEGLKCVEYAELKHLFCTKKVTVYPKPNAVAKRLLLEFSLVNSPLIETILFVESETRHEYSPEFAFLAKDFYLKL